MKRCALILFVLVGSLAGCQKNPPAAPPAPVAAPPRIPPAVPTKAQGKLQTIRLWLGPEELQTELALTEEQEQTGMMFRTNMPENTGMLFVLPVPMRASFWMANCPLPLSAAYMDSQGIIEEIHPLNSYDTNAVLAAVDNIKYVLEVNQGWFDRHHIPTGTLVRSEIGSLPETFVRRRP